MQIRREAQAVLYDVVENIVKVLLVKKIDLKKYMYRWRLLKGGLEQNESEEQALAREIREEVGLKNFSIGKKVYEYEFTFQNILHRVWTFVVKGDSKEKMVLQTDEIADSAWISVEQAKKILFWENEKEALKNFMKIHHQKLF